MHRHRFSVRNGSHGPDSPRGIVSPISGSALRSPCSTASVNRCNSRDGSPKVPVASAFRRKFRVARRAGARAERGRPATRSWTEFTRRSQGSFVSRCGANGAAVEKSRRSHLSPGRRRPHGGKSSRLVISRVNRERSLPPLVPLHTLAASPVSQLASLRDAPGCYRSAINHAMLHEIAPTIRNTIPAPERTAVD